MYLLIKRGNFYTHANYQKIKLNIFPVFYLFYGTYKKIFILFGSMHNLLHKYKHKAKTAQKEKEKKTAQRAAAKSARRPARLRPSHTSTTRARSPPHAVSDGSSVFGELSASAMRRASFPNLPRIHRHPLHPLSPILAPVTMGTADGRLGRANAGHYERVELKPKDA